MFRLERRLHPALRPDTWTRSVRVLGIFRPYLARNRWPLAGAGACVIGEAAIRLARPWPLKVLVDDLLIPLTGPGAGAFPWMILAGICGAILAIGVLGSLFMHGQLVFAGRAGQRIASSLRRKLFGHLLSLPVEYHRNASKGELLTLLSGDVQLLKELLVNVFLGLGSSVIIVAAMLGVMLVVNPWMALVAVALLPLVAVTSAGFSVTMRKVTRRQREQEAVLAGSAQEALHAIPVIKLFGREEEERRRFASVNRLSRKSGVKMKRLQAGLNRNVELFLALGMCAFVAVGAFQVSRGALSVGELLVFLSYYRGFQKPLRKIAAHAVRMAKAGVCGERIAAVLDLPGEPVVDAAAEGPRLTGAIRVDDVAYAYGSGPAVLDHVSFEVPAGAKIAVVGPSGAGKTTLLYLLAGLLAPKQGRILYDDLDGESLGPAVVRSRVSAVLQEPYLFRGTVSDNVRYGRLDADADAVRGALDHADATGFVDRLPGGPEAVLGDQGMTLSGGQRRRLAVARAMLRDAPIIVLDEPVTGLDERAQDEVRAALDALTEGRTSFWSSHDPGLLHDADYTLTVLGGSATLRPGPPSRPALVESQPETLRAGQS